MVHCILIIHVAEKLCCEWTTLFILNVTDTQRRLIAALVIDERRKKSAKMNFHCTVYTGTTWNDFGESHQLRTMNARGHINSVP
jgi:hypothetical protein